MVTEDTIRKLREDIKRIDEFQKSSVDVSLFRNLIARRKVKDFTLQVRGTKTFRNIPKEEALRLKKEFNLKPMRAGAFDLGFKGLVTKKRLGL